MFGMVILDVSIGLIFFYLLFSLIGSAVAETLELVLKARARTLAEGIRSLLFDPNGKDMAKKFYDHPLIKTLRREPQDLPLVFSLFRGVGKGWERLTKNVKAKLNLGAPTVGLSRFELPSYIPSNIFFTALMDTLVNKPEATAQALDLAKVRDAIKALTQGVETAEGGKKPGEAEKNLRELGRALSALLPDTAAKELSEFQTKVEAWFNSSMDRVSGWYKQRTQWVLFLIGLITAVLMNADTIRIAQALSRDRAVRESVVAAAQQYVTERQTPAPSAPGSSGTAQTGDFAKDLQVKLDAVSDSVNKVEALGLPLGWSDAERATFEAKHGGEWWRLFCFKLLGLLTTAVAVALGAPFWFDLLNKFMVVRSTVKPQEKSQKEGSKDG